MKSNLKIRRCKFCNEKFQQIQPLQYLCMPPKDCSWKYQEVLKANKEKKDWRDKKAVMKEKLLTHKDYLKLLQTVFNTFIRLRDKDRLCICCDKPLGKVYHAGHFFNVGAHPNVRFNEYNVHAQREDCNLFKHGNLIEYSIMLPIRIGYDNYKKLLLLKNEPNKLTIPELKEKIIEYKNKTKQLTTKNK